VKVIVEFVVSIRVANVSSYFRKHPDKKTLTQTHADSSGLSNLPQLYPRA